jgi:adenylate kinase
MNIILFGPPGAGKGTQGSLLSKRTGLPKVATGDLIRTAMRERTELGRKAKSYYDQGLLVPDGIIVNLIRELLASPDVGDGLIMDGFPRTPTQAEAVDAALAQRGADVNAVLSLNVPEKELIRRLSGRAREEGRSDDTPEAIQRRLDVYRKETAPVMAHYRARGVVHEIDGTGSVEEIAARIDEVLSG